MGCTGSKAEVSVAPLNAPQTDVAVAPGSARDGPTAALAAATDVAQARVAIPSPVSAVVDVKEFSDKAAVVVQAALGDVPVAIVQAVARISRDNAPELTRVLGQLCGGASDVLSALAPAAFIAGPVLVVAQLALDQFSTYAESLVAAEDLRKAILAVRPTIEQFASAPSLAKRNAELLGAACVALLDAVDLVKKLTSQGSAKLRVKRFLLAGADLARLQGAAEALHRCVGTLGAAAAVTAASGVARIEQQVAELAGALKADPERRARLRAALTEHLLLRSATDGCRLPPMFGLDLEGLADVPPADVSLWTPNDGGDAGSGAGVKMTSGKAAMRELLAPHPSAPGVRVIIGAAGMGKTWLLNTVAACHAAASLGSESAARARVTLPPVDRGGVNGRLLRDTYKYARVLIVRLRDLRVEHDDAPWAGRATVAEAVAACVALLLDLGGAAPEATPADLAADLFSVATAPHSLWLLDGFDEVPAANEIAPGITAAVSAAFHEATSKGLPSPSSAKAEEDFRGSPASSVPASARLSAVLRVLLTQPAVVVSSRPQFEAQLAALTGGAVARFLRLEPLPTKAVHTFVVGALKSDPSGLQRVVKRMGASPALLEAMRTPVLMLIAVASYRCAGADEGGASVDDDDSSTSVMSSLAPAPGGPTDVQLAGIDVRAPVAGLYVRAERLLARQVWTAHSAAADAGSVPRENRVNQWLRLRGLLSRSALEGCATPGAARVRWPPGDAESRDLELLTRARVVAVDSASDVEFPHRSLQEYFAATAALQELYSGDGGPPADFLEGFREYVSGKQRRLPMDFRPPAGWAPPPSDTVLRALSDSTNDMMRHMAVALCRADQVSCDRIVSALSTDRSMSEYCDLLGDYIRYIPCATSLSCRPLLDAFVALFWESGPTGETVQRLGYRFWATADVVSGGSQARRAIDEIRAGMSATLAQHASTQPVGIDVNGAPVHVGDIVEACFQLGGTFYPGIVTSLTPTQTFTISYDDGETESGVLLEYIRRPTSDAPVPVIPTLDAAAVSTVTVGDRVMARFQQGSKFYPGKVSAVVSQADGSFVFDVDYDDGDKESGVSSGCISRFSDFEAATSAVIAGVTMPPLAVGDKVEARYKGRSKYYPGKIASTPEMMLFGIKFHDGDVDEGVSSVHVRAIDPKIAKRDRACAAAQVLGSISRFTSPELLQEAHKVLQDAAVSPIEALAAEAVFARVVLDPLPVGGTGADPSASDMRQRLLALAQRSSGDTRVADRAAAELVRRFTGDSDVNAALKRAAAGAAMTPFIAACVEGPGLPLISLEVACTLFQWLPPDKSASLAHRMWDARSDGKRLVAERFTPLHIAAMTGHHEFILVFCGPSYGGRDFISAKNVDGDTPIALAETAECVAALLDAGADPSCRRSGNSRTPLHVVATSGNEAVVSVILSHPGADLNVDSKGSGGPTPIYNAAAGGHSRVVALLLKDARVDPNIRGRVDSMTPLIAAACDSYESVVRVLLESPRVDVFARDSYGFNALDRAALNGRVAVVELFLADGRINPNEKGASGLWCPIHHAADLGHADVIRLLLSDPRVDVNAADKDGKTALDWATGKAEKWGGRRREAAAAVLEADPRVSRGQVAAAEDAVPPSSQIQLATGSEPSAFFDSQ